MNNWKYRLKEYPYRVDKRKGKCYQNDIKPGSDIDQQNCTIALCREFVDNSLIEVLLEKLDSCMYVRANQYGSFGLVQVNIDRFRYHAHPVTANHQ